MFRSVEHAHQLSPWVAYKAAEMVEVKNMGHGKKSALVCLVGAVALGAVLAGCARSNSASVAATPVNTQASESTTAQASMPTTVVAADAVPEVVVGASRGDDVEVVVKASRNDPKLVALSVHKASH
jgi:hypothetical protein